MLKVSIIKVCFNAGKTIADTINSIVEQSYPNIEVIVIDGNSTDDTQQIVHSFGQKVHVFVSEPDLGIYDAMNKGMAKASGDVIGIPNADDVLAKKTVIQEIAAGFVDENIDCLHGDLVYVDANNLNKVVRYWKAGLGNPNKFLFGWMPPHPTFYIRKPHELPHTQHK